MERLKDERATGSDKCKPKACNVAKGEAAEAVAYFKSQAAKKEKAKGMAAGGAPAGTQSFITKPISNFSFDNGMWKQQTAG